MRISVREAGGACRGVGAVLLMGWLGGVVVGAEAGDSGGFTRGPYLQCATAQGVTVVWRTRGEVGRPVLRYGSGVDKLEREVSGGAVVVSRAEADGGGKGGIGLLAGAPAGTTQYEVAIAGLPADSVWHYGVYDGEKRLTAADGTFTFRTLSAVARPMRLWVVGDSGTGNRVQAQIHEAMRRVAGREKRYPDLYLHVGDMAYGSGLDSEFQGYFFEPYEATLRNTCCFPAFGNHEGRSSKSATGKGPYYDCYVTPREGQSGGVASGTESYYSFDAGGVHFISLNSFDTSRQPDGAMGQWLKADLERAKADWLVAFWHHPPYTKGTHDSDDRKKAFELVEMRELILPILESAGVDLVLCGHSHIYERSMLIDGAYATPTTAAGVVLDDGDGDPSGDGAYRKSAGLEPHRGTVAMVAGHGGTTLGRKKTASPVMKVTWVEFGSVLIDVEGKTLTSRMINEKGEVRDTFRIVKEGNVPVVRMAAPVRLGEVHGPAAVPVATPDGKEGAVAAAGKLPARYRALIPKGADWQYLAGAKPAADWAGAATVTGWKTGAAGFGYDDADDATLLADMRGKYKYVCLRRTFTLKGDEDLSQLGLAVSYDDGFICYLNGREVVRANVESGALDTARGVSPHEADRKYRYFPLGSSKGLLRPGVNVIAIEAHNDDLGSSDLTMDPYLIFDLDAAAAAKPEGDDP